MFPFSTHYKPSTYQQKRTIKEVRFEPTTLRTKFVKSTKEAPRVTQKAILSILATLK